MKRDEAELLASEINRTPDWQALGVDEAPYLNASSDEYRVQAWHRPSGTIE